MASVVTPERAAIALNYFWEKAGERATTYSGLESDAAMKHLDTLIARQRQAATPVAHARRNAVR